MKKYLFVLALACASLSAWSGPTKVTTAAEDRTRFMEFLEEQSKAGVCIARLPDFNTQFQPLLRKFKVRNEYVLRLGDAFIRAEAVRDQITIEEKVEKATRTAVNKLKAASDEELQKACSDVLKWFGPDGPYSGKPPEPPKPAVKPPTPPGDS